MPKELTNSVINGFNNGDVRAFQEIFEFHYDDIFYFAWKMLDSKEDAQDVAMEIFENLYLKKNTFQTVENIKAFLYISTRNKSIDYIRRREYQEQHQQAFAQKMENDKRLALERDLKHDLLDAIQDGVSKLPKTCQTIFRKLFYDGLKPAEIALELGISIDNVYNQKKRALQLLRLELKDVHLATLLLLVLLVSE